MLQVINVNSQHSSLSFSTDWSSSYHTHYSRSSAGQVGRTKIYILVVCYLYSNSVLKTNILKLIPSETKWCGCRLRNHISGSAMFSFHGYLSGGCWHLWSKDVRLLARRCPCPVDLCLMLKNPSVRCTLENVCSCPTVWKIVFSTLSIYPDSKSNL